MPLFRKYPIFISHLLALLCFSMAISNVSKPPDILIGQNVLLIEFFFPRRFHFLPFITCFYSSENVINEITKLNLSTKHLLMIYFFEMYVFSIKKNSFPNPNVHCIKTLTFYILNISSCIFSIRVNSSWSLAP